jgi:hypothetical protein
MTNKTMQSTPRPSAVILAEAVEAQRTGAPLSVIARLNREAQLSVACERAYGHAKLNAMRMMERLEG